MSSSAPEQLDSAGPRGGPAGGPATGREVSGRLPWMLVVPALVGLAFLVLPLAGLLIRAPWSTLVRRLAE
ncbi:molybdate ABC transporter permease subunit, partial [Nonomuraea sp. NPDC005650]